MRRHLRSKRTIALAGLAAIAITAAAIAFWTASGTGTGSGSAGDVQALTVNQDSSVTGLYPGGPSKDLSGDFDNPNPATAYIAKVTAAVTAVQGTDADGAKPDCTTADFEIDDNVSTTPGEVPTGNDQGSWSGLSVRMLNGAANQDNCKNRDITITYTAHAAP